MCIPPSLRQGSRVALLPPPPSFWHPQPSAISKRLAGVWQRWEGELDMSYASISVVTRMVHMGLQAVALGCRSSGAARWRLQVFQVTMDNHSWATYYAIERPGANPFATFVPHASFSRKGVSHAPSAPLAYRPHPRIYPTINQWC